MISYDIHNDKRRYKVCEILKGHGKRVQYSVFECELTTTELYRLRERLLTLINPDESDSIRFYTLCKACYDKVECIGKYDKIETEDYYLL